MGGRENEKRTQISHGRNGTGKPAKARCFPIL
jgi:hypothetical protein